jgi:hypothetical protein
MSKKNMDLKDRLKALRVNEPLRLSKSGPEFKAPETIPGKEVTKPQVPPHEQSQSEAPRIKKPQLEEPRSEATQIEGSRAEVPHIKHAKNDKLSTITKAESTPIELPPNIEVTQVEATDNRRARIEIPRNERARVEDAEIEGARNENTQTECAQKEVARNGRPSNRVPQNEPPKNERPQEEKDALFEGPRCEQTQFELPHVEETHLTQEKFGRTIRQRTVDTFSEPQEPLYGYFKLAHTVFLEPSLRKVSGDCFRLFIWLSSRAWRYHDSQGIVRASVRFIEQQAGIPHATISRNLRTLREIGIVSLLETDYKHGNVWKVSPVAFGNRGPDIKPPRFEHPQGERSKSAEATSKRATSSLDLRTELPQDECNIRNSRTPRTLSLGFENARVLWAEIEQTRPAEKRKSESACLEQLLENYSTEDLTLALTFLKRNGILRSGERAHSPFRYLATAAEDVIKAARKNASFATVHLLHGRTEGEAEGEKKSVEEDREVRSKALQIFQTEVAEEERKQFVEAYIQSEYPHGYLPPEQVILSLAAMRWVAAKSKNVSCAAMSR